MSDENNIIPFPRSYRYREEDGIPVTEEELHYSIEKVKETFFDMISLELAAPIFNRAGLFGFDVDEDEHIKDCILVVESIKSLLAKAKGAYHPLQEYAQKSIKYEETWVVDDSDESEI